MLFAYYILRYRSPDRRASGGPCRSPHKCDCFGVSQNLLKAVDFYCTSIYTSNMDCPHCQKQVKRKSRCNKPVRFCSKRCGRRFHNQLWIRNNQETVKRCRRRFQLARYGLTEASYAELLVKQNGVCAICAAVPGRRSLAVDHDHRTGKVRGLLCTRCNRSISKFGDDPILLRNAAIYLERSTLQDAPGRFDALLGPRTP